MVVGVVPLRITVVAVWLTFRGLVVGEPLAAIAQGHIPLPYLLPLGRFWADLQLGKRSGEVVFQISDCSGVEGHSDYLLVPLGIHLAHAFVGEIRGAVDCAQAVDDNILLVHHLPKRDHIDGHEVRVVDELITPQLVGVLPVEHDRNSDAMALDQPHQEVHQLSVVEQVPAYVHAAPR